MNTRHTTCKFLAAAFLAAGAAPAIAQPASTEPALSLSKGSGQAYPSRPLRIIVPFAPGRK